MPGDAKPVLVFDGNCGFCRIWIEYWKHLTGDAVSYTPYQEVAEEYPQVPRERFTEAVHLMLPSGEALAGAHAVFQTLASNPSRRWLPGAYERVPGFAPVTEAAYRVIARHRSFFYWVTVLLFGREVKPLQYHAAEWLFGKALALVYLLAFWSFGAQAKALIGAHGVLPAGQYLARASAVLGGASWFKVPSLFWLGSGDAAIQGACIAGAVCALAALFGFFRRAAFAGALLLYLSLVGVSQEFLSYQWDFLLLEAGFLAIFLGDSKVVVWLYRWLLFRLMFGSGVVKLLSGDPSWRHLTALTFHYQTQPIPTPVAWYAQQLPGWFQAFWCALVLFVELAIPFLVLGPRRARRLAAWCLMALQVAILLTGNYAFFNLLALALCVFLFDDASLRVRHPTPPRVPRRVRRAVTLCLAAVIAVLTGLRMAPVLTGSVPAAGVRVLAFAAPFGIANSYGLFAVMTTTRREIVVEGSYDGRDWRGYEFRYKPGSPGRRPPWVAPHQPRLDWQMWFAALGTYRQNMWFLNLLVRLLQGQPEVLRQLTGNPFPGRPPTYVRAVLYDYRFTDFATRRATGQWWSRTPLGVYVPPVTLAELAPLPILRGGKFNPATDERR